MINSCLDYIFTVNEYSVFYEDIEIARFRLLTQSDIYKINSSIFGIFHNNKINLAKKEIKELSLVLTWWIFDKDITEDNIQNLNTKFLNPIMDSYYRIKNEYEQNYESYYSNIREYILLMENEANSKYLNVIMKSEAFLNKLCSNCRQNESCTRKETLPKILEVSKLIVRYAYQHINQHNDYLFHDKGYEDQPIWFIQFLQFAIREIMQIKEKKNKSKDR